MTRADTTTVKTLQAAAGTVSRSVDPTSVTIPGRETEDDQWASAAKDYASTRFSELDQINATNTASLKPARTFSTGVLRGQEAAPLVVGPTMYVVSRVGGWCDAIVAGGLDARDSSSALGFASAMRDPPSATTKGGTLYVFALP